MLFGWHGNSALCYCLLQPESARCALLCSVLQAIKYLVYVLLCWLVPAAAGCSATLCCPLVACYYYISITPIAHLPYYARKHEVAMERAKGPSHGCSSEVVLHWEDSANEGAWKVA
jgi:hypothetical protein